MLSNLRPQQTPDKGRRMHINHSLKNLVRTPAHVQAAAFMTPGGKLNANQTPNIFRGLGSDQQTMASPVGSSYVRVDDRLLQKSSVFGTLSPKQSYLASSPNSLAKRRADYFAGRRSLVGHADIDTQGNSRTIDETQDSVSARGHSKNAASRRDSTAM